MLHRDWQDRFWSHIGQNRAGIQWVSFRDWWLWALAPRWIEGMVDRFTFIVWCCCDVIHAGVTVKDHLNRPCARSMKSLSILIPFNEVVNLYESKFMISDKKRAQQTETKHIDQWMKARTDDHPNPDPDRNRSKKIQKIEKPKWQNDKCSKLVWV